MKKMMYMFGFIVISITINSCSSDNAEENGKTTPPIEEVGYTYSDSELETMKVINEYRVSIGLNTLIASSVISVECQNHNKYMIANKVVNHDDFEVRYKNIVKALKAKSVAENVAYNYKEGDGVLKAWLESPGHKENLDGDYTHFGLSVTTDSAGKKYYTNIFAKI